MRSLLRGNSSRPGMFSPAIIDFISCHFHENENNGRGGAHPLHWCTSGTLYLPLLSLFPTKIGLTLHVINTSSSLNTAVPSLVNINMQPSSANRPTLRREFLKSSNMSAVLARLDSPERFTFVLNFPLLLAPFAPLTVLSEAPLMGIFACFWSFSLM